MHQFIRRIRITSPRTAGCRGGRRAAPPGAARRGVLCRVPGAAGVGAGRARRPSAVPPGRPPHGQQGARQAVRGRRQETADHCASSAPGERCLVLLEIKIICFHN